jgi:hypothetical protein
MEYSNPETLCGSKFSGTTLGHAQCTHLGHNTDGSSKW